MRVRLTFSNVLSMLALFVALGGSAYAALTVTGKNVKDGSLTGADVKDRSLAPADFSGSVVGPQGPQGVPGAKGDTGPQGPAGTVGTLTEVTGAQTSGSSSANITLKSTAQCPSGQRAVSGGFVMGYGGSGSVWSSRMGADGSSWEVLGYGTAPRVSAVAYCVA